MAKSSGEKIEASEASIGHQGDAKQSSEQLSLVAISSPGARANGRSTEIDQFNGFGSVAELEALYNPPAGGPLEPAFVPRGERPEPAGDRQGNREIAQREYTVKAGDTSDSIARRELGREASPEALKAYTELVTLLNGTPRPGDKIVLPTVHKDGTFSFINPDDTNESYKYLGNGTVRVENTQSKHGFVQKSQPDGTVTKDSWGPNASENCKHSVYPNGSERAEFKDGTGFTREPTGEEKHWGPKAEDNWTRSRDGAKVDHKPDGSVVTSWRDGSELHQFKDGRGYSKHADGWVTAWGPKADDNYTVTPSGSKHWKDSWGVSHSKSTDGSFGVNNDRFHLSGKVGSEINLFDKKGSRYELRRDVAVVKTDPDGTVVRYEKNLDQITTYPDGTSKHSNPLTGKGYLQKPDLLGGYSKHHWGKRPEDNYEEKYDAKTGITTTVDALGDKTTKWPNNGIKVERHDHSGYVRQPDGSEHHWGPTEKDNFDTKRDHSAVAKSRQELDRIADREIPEKDRALFKENLNKFEERAKKEHISPEEVAKTYEQMGRLLSASDAKVSKSERVLLAENIAHHLNHDDMVDQGQHSTCNVTTLAERGFSRNPAKMAEIIATTAIKGAWTAPDGKVITLDPGSLIPRAEERNNPPRDGDRSYAVQILNLVMVNDGTQRRIPASYYRQQNPDPNRPGDTGERLVGGDGKPLMERESYVDFSNSPPEKKYRDVPISSPTLIDSEIYATGKRISGDANFYITNKEHGDGVVKYESVHDLRDRLIEMKNQHRLPAVLAVNANEKPFGSGLPGGPSGYHVVSIREFDESTGRVRVSNQWGSKNDQWVAIGDLHKNTTI